MSGAARYAAILRTPAVAPLVLASMVARLPIAMYGLAIVLYLAEARGSFAVAGVVDGAFGVGAAIGAPTQSRYIDRLGQRAVLVPLAVVNAAATGLLIALTEAGAPLAALMACGFAAGFAIPTIGSALRALWPVILERRADLVATAFALDSVVIETLFTVGPLLTGAIIAVISPVASLALSGVCGLVGTLAFVVQPPSRDWRPHADAGAHGVLGALRSTGVRTVVLATLPLGFCFGAVEISLPAFAKSFGAPEWAGVLLAVWAMASAAGGLAYGARTWRDSLPSIYLRLAALMPLGFLPALLAPNLALMALLIVPGGFLIAPLGAAANQLVGEIAPAGAATEAYTWPLTAMIAGFAGGTAVGGALIETADWRACFVAASLAAATGALIAFARRGSLAAEVQPA